MVKNTVCKPENIFNGLFSEQEIKEYKNTIIEALKVLNKKNLSLIIHNPSFPSKKGENTGVGTINSNGGKEFINFIEELGFNNIQLGPDGKTKSTDASPYIGTIFSTNPLFIDLFELTTSKWANILDTDTVKRIVENNPNKDNSKLAYSYIFEEQNKALSKAYTKFAKKLSEKKVDKTITKLNKKYIEFQKENAIWLDKDSLYEALSKKHGNDYWPMWNDELDKKLFCPEYIGTQEANDRIKELEKDYATEIDFYKFCQFIANEQKEETIKYTSEHNVKTMADIQVAFSDRDYWAYQALFLPGYYLGCPPDMFSRDGQAWGFPVLDPEKIYNEDGSLGESGKLLKFRFDKVFKENSGGARIDHAVGLIDPWVYRIGKTAKPSDGGSRLFSSPENDAFKKYARIEIKDIHKYGELDEPEFKLEDPNALISSENELRVNLYSLENPHVLDEYSKVVDIILKSAKEHNVDKEFIIYEDLGTITNPVKVVMQKRHLSGIRVTQFNDPEKWDHIYRGKNIDAYHWVTAATHDNLPLAVFINDLYNKNTAHPHVVQLAEDLIPDELAGERQQFIDKLHHDRREFVKAKLVELFVSRAENIQIFFNDLLGIEELYNVPGTAGSENWSLRVPNNYIDYYFDKLKNNLGMNIPDILKTAIEAKGSGFVEQALSKNPELLNELEKFANKFKG